MAVILDAWELESQGTANPGSRTVSAGTDRLLIYIAALRDSANSFVTGVTYGGEDMTNVLTAVSDGVSGAGIHASVWILDDAGIAAAGSTDFAITRSSADGVGYKAFTAVYEEVNQLDPIVAAYTALGADSVDPVADLLLTGASGVAVFALLGGNTDGLGDTDILWSAPVVEAIESNNLEAPTTVYGSVAEAPGVGVGVTPGFDLTFNLHTVLAAFALRHNAIPLAASVLDVWTLLSVSSATAISPGIEHAISAGSNRLFLVAIGEESSNKPPIGVLYGGQAMAQIIFAQVLSGFPLSVSLWGLGEEGIAGAGDDTTIVVNFDGAHGGGMSLFAATYQDVGQVKQIIDTFSAIAVNQDPAAAVLDTLGNAVAVAMVGNSVPSVDVAWSGASEQVEFVGTTAAGAYYSIAAFPHTQQEVSITADLSGDVRNVALIAFTMAPAAANASIRATAAAATAAMELESGNIVIAKIRATAAPATASIDAEVITLSGSVHRVRGSVDVRHAVRGEL